MQQSKKNPADLSRMKQANTGNKRPCFARSNMLYNGSTVTTVTSHIALPVLDVSSLSSLPLLIFSIPAPSYGSLLIRAIGQCICLLTLTRKAMVTERAPRSNSEWPVWVLTETIASATCSSAWTLSKPSLECDGLLVSSCLIKICLAPWGPQLLHHCFQHCSMILRAQIISLHLTYASIVLASKSIMSYLSIYLKFLSQCGWIWQMQLGMIKLSWRLQKTHIIWG